MDMGAAQAECWEHGPGKCHVRSVDLLIVGTSCKDMSRANSGTVRQELVLNSTESRGGSAQTFHGLMQYVERHRPLMIFFENVDAMEDMNPEREEASCLFFFLFDILYCVLFLSPVSGTVRVWDSLGYI